MKNYHVMWSVWKHAILMDIWISTVKKISRAGHISSALYLSQNSFKFKEFVGFRVFRVYPRSMSIFIC